MTPLIYHGTYYPQRCRRDVAVESQDGQLLGWLTHHARHSPTGFGWGYAGSGPADLARSLLISALGTGARCPTCSGTGHLEIRDSGSRPARSDSDPELICPCQNCDEGTLVTPALYQRFKFDVVTTLDDDWRLGREQVRRWWFEQVARAAEPRTR